MIEQKVNYSFSIAAKTRAQKLLIPISPLAATINGTSNNLAGLLKIKY
jgi:hypothetical protein